MTSFNPFADAVSIIRNGYMASLRDVTIPFSSFILNFLMVLKDEGYIGDVSVKEVRQNVKAIVVQLKYYRNKMVISDIKVISKPSRRVYWAVNKFRKFYDGLGLYLISTSSGILPNYKACKMNVGGEVLCGVF